MEFYPPGMDIDLKIRTGLSIYLIRIGRRPLPCLEVIGQPIRLVLMGHLGPQGIIGIGIGEKGQNGQQDLGNGQRRGPLVLENVQADDATGIDIRMIDLRHKGDLGGLKGIVGGEVDIHLEDPAGERGIARTHNHAGPVIQISLLFGATGATRGRVLHDILEFLFNSAKCHYD